MSKEVSSIQLRTIDLMDQRRKIDEKIKETMQEALYEALQKMHSALEAAGFDTDDIDVDVNPEGLMIRMNGIANRRLLRIFCNRGAGPSGERVAEWCRKHYSQVDPLDFIRRNKFFFEFIDWEKLLLEETKSSDIPVEGECPELNGKFDYTGEWDTFALDGKRYCIEVGQQFVLNGSWRQWAGGQFVN